MYNRKIFSLIITIYFLITGSAWASLAVHPNSLRDTVAVGKSKAIMFHITNLGPASILSYTISSDANWLVVKETSGLISKGDSVKITITFDASKLVVGNYNATLTLGDPHHGPLTIPVALIVETMTSVDEKNNERVLTTYLLDQNFPNPFSETTTITYTVPSINTSSKTNGQHVSITIYSLLGEEIATLIDGAQQTGTYSVKWKPAFVPKGMYFYRIQIDRFIAIKRMVFTN